VASPADLDAIIELESWTDDQISEELGILQRIPEEATIRNLPNITTRTDMQIHKIWRSPSLPPVQKAFSI
jgi:hypothetical protein